METTIQAATLEDKPALDRLMQFYLYDFSGLAPREVKFGHIDDDGRIADNTIERYWERKWKMFSIRADGYRAGFAMVNDWAPSGTPADHVLAEFFVARKYRRCGVGRQAAHALFAALPGEWELATIYYNSEAHEFWHRTLQDLPGYAVTESAGDGRRWKGRILRLTPVR